VHYGIVQKDKVQISNKKNKISPIAADELLSPSVCRTSTAMSSLSWSSVTQRTKKTKVTQCKTTQNQGASY